ncbi:hypothetical protein R3W88_032173 [Solanum pinnatisectum]|uniref:RNase H type-1 domain-containing protein n=1 Tax=Solanum pinnatisectum TaxID=50273 RepID=A0AAV9LNF6_9SOLN|nr:hypothetical protein R3W88_032173 [Solanum pinnatisectum]
MISLMEKLGAAMPTHIFREQNQVPDKLSKEGLNCTTFGQPIFWIVPLLFAKKLVWTDILGTVYSRKLNPFINDASGHTTTPNSICSATGSQVNATLSLFKF